MAAASQQQSILPIENFMFSGIQKRFSEVFGCVAIWNTAFDKGVALKKTNEGEQVKTPYAWLSPTNIATNTESYNRKSLARHGVTVLHENGITHKAKLVPTIFDIEVEYVTDKFMGVNNTVMAFIRRWHLTAVQGHMRFGFAYGRMQFNISGITLSDAVPITPRENPTEGTTLYTVNTSMQVKGYVSEPMLIQSSTVQELYINEQLLGADGSVAGAEFWNFDELRVTNK